MRVLLLFFFLFSSLWSSDPYKNITFYKLDNGLSVYLYPDNKAKNININVDVKVGMKVEDKSNAGISHLVEHIVFRDQRVKDKDYLNLFNDEGATFVNGYTKQYKTQYLATINADKSYWIVEQFAQMLLDKNVTNEDLKSERGALQVEIGEVTWVDRFLPDFRSVYEKLKYLTPDGEDFYRDEFDISIEEEKRKYVSRSIYRLNNQKFTFDEVMKHYTDYYYPSNMVLSISGDFNLDQMRDTIKNSFGSFVKSEGKSVEKKHQKIAILNKEPYERYDISMGRNRASIGAKFISNDPKKIIILDSYVNDLGERLNKIFRNKNGESYGVYGFSNQYHNGAVVSVRFNAPHSAFDKNIEYVQKQIEKESSGELANDQIKEALKASLKEYNALEHDSSSLMKMIFSYQDFKKMFDETKTPYEILNSITPREFRAIVKETFVPENSYKSIYRDYHFFPYDFVLFFSLLTFLMFYGIYRLFSIRIDKRNIRMQRSLTNWFLSFLMIVLSVFIAGILTEWIFYFIAHKFPISYLRVNGYDMPISYFAYLVEFLISILIIYVIIKLFLKWLYIKLYVTNNSIILSGTKNKYIKHSDIKLFEVVPWSFSKWSAIHGVSLLFWKPLLKLTSNLDEVIYLRTSNAEHLKDDLEYIISEVDKKRTWL